MKLIFTDCKNNLLKNTEIDFEYKKSTETISTDEKGIINLKGLPENVEISCFINKTDKHSIKFIEKSEIKIELKLEQLDMIFVVLNKNKESLIDLPVFFEYNGKKEELISDNTGQITLKDVPVGSSVKVYQIFNDKEYNIEVNKCVKDKAQYFFVGERLFETNDMKLKLVDDKDEIIRNADIRIKLNDNEFESKTDTDGCVFLTEIELGATVSCKQLVFGKSLPWHEVVCEKEVNEYVIHGVTLSESKKESSILMTVVKMKFKLVDSELKPIPNAILKLEYDGKVRNKYTNQNGETSIEDIRVGSKIKVLVDIRGKNTVEKYICNEDNELHEIKIDISNKKIIYAFLGAIALIAVIILISKIDFSIFSQPVKTQENEIVEDTIIRNYKYSVKDEITGESVKYPKISLIYKDTIFSKKIKNDAFANFKAIENKTPTEVNVAAIGYLPYKESFILDSINEIILSRDTLVFVDDKIENCGLFIKSEFNGTTIKNFNLNSTKGRFKLFYNMFAQPDKIEIYKGNIYNISKENLLYSSKIGVINMMTTYVNYETTDSIISVKISGINNNKGWIYKVFCPKTIYPQNNN